MFKFLSWAFRPGSFDYLSVQPQSPCNIFALNIDTKEEAFRFMQKCEADAWNADILCAGEKTSISS